MTDKLSNKNNDQPYWLNAQKSTRTYFREKLEAICTNRALDKKLDPSWKGKAFFEIYNHLSANKAPPSGAIAKKYNMRVEYVSRWIHSREFEDLALMYSRIKYMSLLPKAIKTVEDMLVNGAEPVKKKEDKIRYAVAKDIIEHSGIFKQAPVGVAPGKENPAGGVNVNIFNLSTKELEAKIKEKTNRIKNITGGK